MTNGEKYKEELLHLAKNNEVIAMVDGKLMPCDDVDDGCASCSFGKGSCVANLVKWIYEEYHESQTINQAEYDYLSFVNRLYGEDALVYRGASAGHIMILYSVDENALSDCFSANTYECAFVRKYNRYMLPFINSKTTMTVGELLKLKVVE